MFKLIPKMLERVRPAAEPAQTKHSACAVMVASCPQCGYPLDGPALSCPRCRQPLEAGCSGNCSKCGSGSSCSTCK
ncbi:hypothetical protein [Paradesulfitobacterium ferrireducens]|uniref:hypothetical protein n=1 Tax=Paradesulfitobacterium ferrireducens TaxID=2816476 RepID=UPI001A8E72D4|nr:hypothetical protein [Paradesulfitobacterium ferrireducens]